MVWDLKSQCLLQTLIYLYTYNIIQGLFLLKQLFKQMQFTFYPHRHLLK